MGYLLSHLSNIVNAIGLISDIAGVILVWKFGIPEVSDRSGRTVLGIAWQSPEEAKQIQRYLFWSRIGLIAIIAGFGFQLLSDFI